MKLKSVWKFLFFIVASFVLAAILLTARQMAIIARLTKLTNYQVIPYTQKLEKPRLSVLFLGDSTAVGTGAAQPSQSTAGYFGRDFPDAEIDNVSRNGKKIHELLIELKDATFKQYDLVVIQIGGNDIMRLTPLKNVQEDLVGVLQYVSRFGRHVVILHSGNVGIAPIFYWPFDVILAERSKSVRAIYRKCANESGVVYVDLFSERNNDLFLKDIKRYYSGDLLHPSAEGYRFWYQRIRESLNDAGIDLN